jgi:hypothetical protein
VVSGANPGQLRIFSRRYFRAVSVPAWPPDPNSRHSSKIPARIIPWKTLGISEAFGKKPEVVFHNP